MVTSLTLPAPTAPVFLSLGRRNVTIEWRSAFTAAPQDLTTFGFKIDICRIANAVVGDRATAAASGSSDYESESENFNDKNNAKKSKIPEIDITQLEWATETSGATSTTAAAAADSIGSSSSKSNQKFVCRNVTVVRPSITTFTAADKLIELSAATDGSDEGGYRFAVILGAAADIQPSTYYFVRLSTVYNTFNSTPSLWSPVIRTRPLIPPNSFPPLTYVRNLVNQAFQIQRERHLNDTATSGKLKKRLPKPVLVNNSLEATYLHTVGSEREHVTGTLSTSIYISFLKPIDDGGSPMLGYEVYARPVGCQHMKLHHRVDTTAESAAVSAAECTPAHNALIDHLPDSWTLFDSFIQSSATISASNVMLGQSALYKAKSFVATHLPLSLDVVTLQVNNLHMDTFYGE